MGYFPSISGNNHVVIILVIVIVVIIVIAMIIKSNRRKHNKHHNRRNKYIRSDGDYSNSEHHKVDMSLRSRKPTDRKKTHHNSTLAPVQPNMNKISGPLMANSNIHVHRTYNILPYKRKNGSTTGPMRRYKSSNLRRERSKIQTIK